MRTGILAVVALMMGGVAIADDPSPQPVPQQVIEDLSELRQELGATNSSPAEFAQAVQNLAERRVEGDSLWNNSGTVQAWAADGGPQPPPQPAHNPWSPFGAHPVPAPHQQPDPSQSPPPGQVVPVVDERSTPQYYQPGPPPYFAPHLAPKPPRPPKVLLQDTAFDLERMAHELDKAELYGEADALRGAATRLRMAARQQKKPVGPQPAPPLAAPGPAPVEHPHAAERARRAVQEADERVRQMERQVREMEARIERQAEEGRRRMQEKDDWIRRTLRGAEQGRQEAPEGLQRPRERRRERPDGPGRYRPELPPPGVHGGPTDPPPAPPQLAPGQ
jgi:hypothetical protein